LGVERYAAPAMRAATVIAILLASVAVQPAQKQQAPSSAQKPEKGSVQTAEPTATSPATPPATGQTSQQESSGTRGSASPKASKWREAFAPPTWSNWALIVVGFGGIVVAVWTLRRIERQTKAAEQAAQVARSNVDAFLVDNRPWLLIEHGQIGEQVGVKIQKPFIEPVGTMPPGEERFSHCVFFIKNYGKTPAKVLTMVAELRIGESSSEPPSGEIREIGERYNPHVFPQGESLAQVAEMPTGIVGIKEREDIDKSRKFLWLRGMVVYRHTFEAQGIPDYETRFGYVWETRMNTPTPFWRLAGPSEWNRAT
jgi:hypothetical protein